VLNHGRTAGAEIHNISLTDPGLGGLIHHTVDLRDYYSVKSAVSGIRPDAILHLAACGVVRGSGMADMLRANILGLQAILEAAAEAETPPRVVLAGSWFEYAPQQRPLKETDPTLAWSEYAASKIAAGTLGCYHGHKLPVTLLRLFHVYGPGEAAPRLLPYIAENALRGAPVELSACEQVRDYVYVEEVAEAFWRALRVFDSDPRFQIVNVGSGRGVKIRTVVETACDVLKEYDLSPKIVFGARPYRSGEPLHAVADTTKLQKLFHWQPAASLADGIRAEIRHIMARRS
jgi:nucleoside-diphosphate-sugar epimerase